MCLSAANPQAWFREQTVDIAIAGEFRKRRFLYRHMPLYSWQAEVTVSAPPAVQRFIWNTGLGSYLSDGFGGVMPTELIPFLRKHAQRNAPLGWKAKPRTVEHASTSGEDTGSPGLQNIGDYLT